LRAINAAFREILLMKRNNSGDCKITAVHRWSQRGINLKEFSSPAVLLS
jgi:hypothetical protein